MAIIYRVTEDLFEFADVIDIAVNPTNLMGVLGAGLAKEFRTRVPEMVKPYQEACKSGELRIGTVQVVETPSQNYDVLNFPTKRHWQDISDEGDITRGLEALRELLQTEKYRYSSVAMPMLGCGLGKQDYPTVQPLIENYLGDLEATVFLSMSPQRTELRPRYLTIVGPLDYARNDEEKQAVDQTIAKIMDAWGGLDQYTGIVSGGYPGTDAYICGEEYRKDEHKTFVYKHTGKMPIVVKPNSVKNGVGSNLHLGNLLCEIGDDIILFKPQGHNNNRMSAMQTWLDTDRTRRKLEGLVPKRIAISGERKSEQKQQQILMPEEGDIPY